MKLPVSYSLGNREASLDKDALMRNALAEQAATPVANSVDDFQKQVLKDAEFWQGLAKQVGLKGD